MMVWQCHLWCWFTVCNDDDGGPDAGTPWVMMVVLKVFHDIGDERIVSQESIMRGRFLGKGAFGAVYAGTMIDKVCTTLFIVVNLIAVLFSKKTYSLCSCQQGITHVLEIFILCFTPPCPFTCSSFPLFTFPFLSLALLIFFFCLSLPFLPE